MSRFSKVFAFSCACTVALASAAAVGAGPPFPVGGGPPAFAGSPPPGVGGGVPDFLTLDSVSGSATFEQFGSPVDLEVDASSDADGSNPQGTVVLTATFLIGGERTLHGDVAQGCMVTTGNEVLVVGKIPPEEQWSVEGFGTVEYAFAKIEDNGVPTAAPVDRATARGLRESTKLAVCDGIWTGDLAELDSGDFAVIDN